MAFFDKNNGIWRSLLDSKGRKTTQQQQNELTQKQILSEAAAANRAFVHEESMRPSLHGVLSVKVRMASLIKFEKNAIDMGGSYCSVTIRNLVKRTQVVQNIAGILKWEQIKHFPIQILRNRRHPYNLVKIELFGYSPSNTAEVIPIGSVSFHLHDILSANPIAGTYDLWNDHIQVGDIDLEFTHTYGAFGYGYSPQLKEDDLKPDEIITYSLFPRVIPSREKREPEHQVMVVCANPHPSYINFKERVYLSYGKEIKEVLEDMADEMYQPVLFEKEMGANDEIRNEYFSTTDRFARLTFLRNYLKGSTNQETVTLSLQDETNLEGDTQHRVLVSKDYTKFVNSEDANDPTSATSNPIMISPPESASLFAGRSTLQAMIDERRKSFSGAWTTGMRASRQGSFDFRSEAKNPPDTAGNQLNIPGAWPGK